MNDSLWYFIEKHWTDSVFVWTCILLLLLLFVLDSYGYDHVEIDSRALLQALVFCTSYGGSQSVLTFCSHCWLADLSSCSALSALRNRFVLLLMRCGRLFPDTHGNISPVHHVCVCRVVFTARCTLVQSAVLRSYVVRLTVCPWRLGTVIT